MKLFKRILCLALSLLFIVQLMTGCSSRNTDDEIYLTKGEFFAYFVYEYGMTSKQHTAVEIQNCNDGSVEADIIAEWGYLTEKQAKKGLNKHVDKETVVAVCAANTNGLLEGDTSKIKDSDMLDNPQLIANAYASGFFELENGYFDGAEKMTLADCEAIMQKSNDYTSDYHFEANTGVIEYSEDAKVLDETNFSEGDFVVESFITDPAVALDESLSPVSQRSVGKSAPVITNLSYSSNDKSNIVTLENSANKENNVVTLSNQKPTYTLNRYGVTGFTAHIKKDTFEKVLKNPKPGDLITVVPKFNDVDIINPNLKYSAKSIQGVLKDATFTGSMYICVFDFPTFEEVATDVNVKKTNASKIEGFVKEQTEYCGWKLEFDTSNNGVSVKASKNFTTYKPGLEKDDKSRKETTKATVEFSANNFNVDVDNIKSFATGKGSGSLKVTYDTKMSFGLAQSLRYTPYNNRNGKFPSNWNRSRWTDSDSKGAKSIKIARFNVSYYDIVGIEVYIYLTIKVDGTAVFTTSIEGGGIEIKSNNGNISSTKLGKKSDSLEGTLNVDGRLAAEAELYLLKFINVITYDVGGYLDADFTVGLYYEDELKDDGLYADPEGLKEYASDDSKFQFCMDGVIEVGVSGELKESGVKLILDAFDAGTSLNFKKDLYTFHFHGENTGFVNECTRGKKESDEVETSEDDDIVLEAYKVILSEKTCQSISIEALPADTVKMLESKKSITVKSNDEDIVTVKYNKKNKTIMFEGNGEGSTEIVITAKKGILWWKEVVEQEISVTVNAVSNVEGMSYTFTYPVVEEKLYYV